MAVFIHPALTTLTECIKKGVAIEEAFDALAKSNMPKEFIDYSLSDYSEDQHSDPQNESTYPIFTINGTQMALIISNERQSSDDNIALCNYDQMIANVGPGDATIAFFRNTSVASETIEDMPDALQPEEKLTLSPKTICKFNAFECCLDLSTASTESLFLTLQSPPVTKNTWIFNQKTLQPVGLTTDNDLLRIQMAIQLLSELDYAPAYETLSKLALQHEQHFIRWEAIRAICLIASEQQSKQLLQQVSTTDPHPHVREAATETLKNIAMN